MPPSVPARCAEASRVTGDWQGPRRARLPLWLHQKATAEAKGTSARQRTPARRCAPLTWGAFMHLDPVPPCVTLPMAHDRSSYSVTTPVRLDHECLSP